MSGIAGLPGVTLDPKDESELEAAFGVTSNAEELVKANRARYSPEDRATLKKGVNVELTNRVQERDEYDPEKSQYGLAAGPVEAALEDHLGHPVETAVVRGSGRGAAISYTYIGDRGSIDKGTVPFGDVFGSAKEKRASRKARAADPDAAAQAKLDEAETKAAEAIREAQEEAQQALDEAREQAEKAIADAQAEAAKIREKAAEDAAKAAEKAKAAPKGGGRSAAAKS